MKVSLIQPRMQRRPVDTSPKARMPSHLGLLNNAVTGAAVADGALAMGSGLTV